MKISSKHKFLLPVLLFSLLGPFVILFFSGDHGLRGFPLDDAWIHLVYGRSIAEHGYLAYNEGIPSTGSTSPFWAYALGIIHILFRKVNLVIWGTKVLGILLHSVMTYLAFKLVTALTTSDLSGLFAGLFLGLSPPLVISSVSGMEIPLGCALCLAGTYVYWKQQWWLSGIFFGLSGLTRPEFAAVIAILLMDMLIQILRKKIPFPKFLVFSLPIVAFAALNLGWNAFVDGRLFPATFYVKAMLKGGLGLTERLVIGFGMITKHPPLAGGLIWVGFLCLLLLKAEKRRPPLVFYVMGLSYLFGNLILIPPSDPEAFYHIRYLLPSVPLFFVGVATTLAFGSEMLLAEIRRKKRPGTSIQEVVFCSVIGLLIFLLTILTVTGLRFWKIKYSRDCRNVNEVQVELGKAISQGLRDDVKIGTVDAGAIRYFGNRVTFDLIGLNTKNSFNCQVEDDRLDALVLMPAWVRLPPDHTLEPILVRKTDDYRVTSNPRMNRQLIAVCQSESNQVGKNFDIQILGKPIRVCLRCFRAMEIDQLRTSIMQ